MGSRSPPSSGARTSSASDSSTSSRSSSAPRIRPRACLLQLGLDLLRELGELREDVDGRIRVVPLGGLLELLPPRDEPFVQLLHALERVLGRAHAASPSSRATR